MLNISYVFSTHDVNQHVFMYVRLGTLSSANAGYQVVVTSVLTNWSEERGKPIVTLAEGAQNLQ
jgi:hypothetical protein